MIVRPSDFRALLGRLDDGDADVALSATPTSGIERRHRVERLHEDSFSVLYDRAQLGRSRTLDIVTDCETPHVLLSILGDLMCAMDEALAEMGYERRVAVAISHFPTAPFVLLARPCLINMPAARAMHYARAFDLELSPLPFPRRHSMRTETDRFHRSFRKTSSRRRLRNLCEPCAWRSERRVTQAKR